MEKTKRPLVSIITICFNLEDEIAKTIESVLRLDFFDLEYIVIDGKSTDRTVEIARNYKEKFEKANVAYHIYSEIDNGIYDAMNKGLKYAHGEWINILTGGDQFHEDFSLAEFFAERKKDHLYFGKSISTFEAQEKIRYLDFNFGNKNWYMHYMPNHQAVFVPRSFYLQNKYDTDLYFYSDTMMLRKAFYELPYVFVDSIVCRFQIGGVSNYYGSYKNYKKTLHDVKRLEKNGFARLKRYSIHSFKFLLQKILGRDKYLRIYMQWILKEK